MRHLKMFYLSLVLSLLIAGATCAADGATSGKSAAKGKLTGAPAVDKTAGGYEISFALTAPNDVTVRIVDARGEVVRHLACGVVGLAKAAEPFAGGALAQRIVWDGKDDRGKAIAAAGCKVTLAVGVAAKFDKFLLYEPNTYKSDRSIIAKGPGDEWLVSEAHGIHLCTMRAFDSSGKFVRSVWPFSLDKPAAALTKHFAVHNRTWNGMDAGTFGCPDWDGNMVPATVNHNARYFFGITSPDTIISSDGCMIGINGMGADFTQLWQMTPDGLPNIWFWHPSWYRKIQETGFKKRKWHLAAGKDGDFYLADSIRHVVGHLRASDFEPIKSFTHSGSKKLDAPAHYIGGGKGGAGNGVTFTGPDDIVVDAEGKLLILDGGSVHVYDSTGAFVKKMPKPENFNELQIPKAVTAAAGKRKGVSFPHFLRIGSGGRLMVRHAGGFVVTDLDGTTYKPFRFPRGFKSHHGYFCFDADGNWYVSVRGDHKKGVDFLWKFTPDGKRAKFGDKDQIDIEPDFHEIKGVHVADNGDIYLVTSWGKWRKPPPGVWKFGNLALVGDKYNLTRVDVYSPDGSLKHKGLVRSQGLNDVAVDRAGNIYAIEATMWHGAQMSDTALGRVTGRARAWPMAYMTITQARLNPMTEHNKRFSLLARVLKFAPTGGVMDGHDGLPGQLWSHAGISGLSPWNCGDECYAGQVCLDNDQRLWAPDTFIYNVKAVDAAGNLIIRVGKYGSEDCTGGGGDKPIPGANIIKDPEIPLARPSGLAVAGDYLFIADTFSHRIVRCKLHYAEKKELPLR